MADNGKNEVSAWVGWVYFAGYLMMLMGIFQSIAGLTALLKDNYYTVHNGTLVALSYTQWGWIHLLIGIVVIAAGSAVLNGQAWGRVLGVILAALSAIANFAFISSYPFWSITIMVVDLLIVYALLVHGDEVTR